MISVIIPTYKPKYYLYDCLKSLYNQTISKLDFEIYLILNGDKNPYWDLIIEYMNDFSELKINLLYSENKGVSNARNMGLDKANGDYICFIDDDDVVSPNYLANLLAVTAENGIIGVSNLKTFVDNSSILGDDYITKAFESGKSHNIFMCRKFMSCVAVKLIPKKIIGDRRFNPKFRNGEDSNFMFLISDKINAIKRTTNDTYYYRRINPSSASQASRGVSYSIIHFIAMEFEYIKCYFRNPLNYNLLFFLSRLTACMVVMLYEIKKSFKKHFK